MTQRKWPGGIVRVIYVLKSKKAAMQISAKRPFQKKRNGMCKGPEEGIGKSQTRNLKKNDTHEMEFVKWR